MPKNKTPGYNLNTLEVLRKFFRKALAQLLYNAILRITKFSSNGNN